MSQRTVKSMFWASGLILFAAGFVGWYDRFAHGHLDANYGSLVPWGLWVAAYIYFIGLSAGSFLISSLVYVFNVKRFEHIGRLALFTAVITLFMALLSIWADLGHMWRAWEVLIYPNFSSPMAWMIWLYSAYMLLVMAELWFLIRHDLAARAKFGPMNSLYRVLALGRLDLTEARATRDRKVVRVLGTIGVPLAIMFHGGVGSLFGVVAARPLWNSGLFPILFLVSALASGGALLTVITAIFQGGLRENRDNVVALGKLVLGLLLLDVLFQISEFLVAFRAGVPADVQGFMTMIQGPFWWVFWVWQIGLGTAIPILLLVLPTRREPHAVAAAGLLVAAGFLGVRLNIVVPGLAMEEVRGIAQAFSSPRISTYYVPSTMEWLVTLGILGLGLLLFGIGDLLLPKEDEDSAHVQLATIDHKEVQHVAA